MEIVLCSPTVYAKFGGKHIVHALHGKDGRVQFQLGGGGGLKTCTGDASLLGGGDPLASSARKWYFQHSQ